VADRWHVGLSLGRAQDFTALAALERADSSGPADAGRADRSYAVRHLRRWPPGAAYAAVAGEAARLACGLPHPPAVAVDATGVGRAVVDLFRAALPRCPLLAVAVTAGHGVAAGPEGPLVPRKELVSTLQVLLQSRRLKVAGALPEARALAAELSSFRARVAAGAAGEEQGAWREAPHDDLVLAVAAAAWAAEALPVPYEGPLVYNDWAPWPGDAGGGEGPPKSPLGRVLDGLGLDPDADW